MPDRSRESRRAVREQLKEQRDELKGMLSEVNAHLAKLDAGGPSAASERGATAAPDAPTLASAARRMPPAEPAASQHAVRKPVLDPVEIVPPHIVERFREEYRQEKALRDAAKQRSAPAAEAAPRPPPDAGGGPSSDRWPQDLEAFQETLGIKPQDPGPKPTRPQPPPPRASARFTQYTGAQSVPTDAEPVSHRRRVEGSRAAQSSMGEVLSSYANS